jgi:hypothetical protein
MNMTKQLNKHSDNRNNSITQTKVVNEDDFDLDSAIERMNQYANKTFHTLSSSIQPDNDNQDIYSEVESGAMAGKI